MPPGAGPAGVRGWLAVFVAVQAILLIYALYRARVVARFLRDGFTQMAGWMPPPFMRPGVWQRVLFDVAALLTWFVATLVGLVLIARRSRRAPPFWTVFWTCAIAYSLVAFVWDRLLEAHLARLTGDSAMPVDETERALQFVTLGTSLVFGTVGLLYWRCSKRVRATFSPSDPEPQRP